MRKFSEIYFFLVAIFSILLLIYSILQYRDMKTVKKTAWSIFHAINIISIISAVISLFVYSRVIVDNRIDKLSLELGGLFIAAITIIFFLAIEIIGTIIYSIQKKKPGILIENIDLRKTTVAIMMLFAVFIVSVISSGIMVNCRDTSIFDIARNNSTQYLAQKYGKQDFVYEECNPDYVTYGILSKSFTGYNVMFKSQKYQTEFSVTTDEKGNVEEDCFIQNYFKDALNNYRNEEEFEALAQRTNAEVKEIENEINASKKIIEFEEIGSYELNGNDVLTKGLPVDYGKVPTKEEMFDVLKDYYMSNSLRFSFIEENLGEKTIKNYCDKIYDILKNKIKRGDFVSRFYYIVSVEDKDWDGGFIANVDGKKYFELNPENYPYNIDSLKEQADRNIYSPKN